MAASQQLQPRDWVLRLLSGLGLRVSDKEAYWLGFHMERFLAFCRKHAAGLDLATAIAAHKRFLEGDEPRRPAWQVDQAAQAVQLFSRGVEHWHWESSVSGESSPRFRLRVSGSVTFSLPPASAVAASPPPAEAEDAVAEMRRALRWLNDGGA